MVRRLVSGARPWWWGLAVLFLVTLAPFSVSAQAPGASDLGQIFKNHDRNSDRTLDREEFPRVIVEAFFFRDRDKDGYLGITELPELSAQGFRAADRDGDGRLAQQYFINAASPDFDSPARDNALVI